MGERERAILKGLRARAAGGRRGGGLRVGIGDDAAVLAVRRGEELVVTTDFSLEDVHFRRGWHVPEAVGHKCLARGLSDIAAMGARPVAAFVSLAVPRELARGRGDATWLDRFYDGLLALAAEWNVPLAGGDLAEAPGGARAGDAIYVTGTLGGAAAELRALMRSDKKTIPKTTPERTPAEHPHFFPEPRLGIGRALARRRLATAAIDISDGLSVDLQHLCEESGLRAEVDGALLPLGSGATLQDALHGGDDYELLFTADAGARVPRRIAGLPVRRIGRMLRRHSGAPQMMLMRKGLRSELLAQGWQHF
jgi:thiamine-monophosphate kinase